MEERDVRIGLADGGSHGRRDLRGIAVHADREPGVRRRHPAKGHVGAREQRILVVHFAVEEIGSDADDREPLVARVRTGHLEATAERLLIRPQLFRHRLVDDGERTLRVRFGIGEVPAAQDANVERAVQVRRDRGEPDVRLLALFVGPALDGRASPAAAPAERDEVGRERRAHARQRFDAPDDVGGAQGARLLRLIRVSGQEEPHRHQRRGLEAGVALLKGLEAPDEQRRAHQQHQRRRHFDDDERVPQPRAAPLASRPASFLERFVEVHAGRLERGGEAEDDAGQDRRR